jgi:hypothetical protein
MLAMMNSDDEAQREAALLSEQSYRASLRVFSRRSSPQEWAMVQEGLSVLYDLNPRRLPQAIAAARRAGDGYADAGQPDWAQKMQDRAAELEQRGRRERR